VTPVLLDTGVIVAMLDRSEGRHRECVEAVEQVDAPLVTCEAVIAEACYLTRDLKGAAEAILENVAPQSSRSPCSSPKPQPRSNASSANTGTGKSIWRMRA